MPKWEMCRLLLVKRHEKPLLLDEIVWEHWVAAIDTPEGPKVLAESPEYKRPNYDSSDEARYNRQHSQHVEALRAEKSKLIGKMLSENWEPLSDEIFRRVLPEKN